MAVKGPSLRRISYYYYYCAIRLRSNLGTAIAHPVNEVSPQNRIVDRITNEIGRRTDRHVAQQNQPQQQAGAQPPPQQAPLQQRVLPQDLS